MHVPVNHETKTCGTSYPHSSTYPCPLPAGHSGSHATEPAVSGVPMDPPEFLSRWRHHVVPSDVRPVSPARDAVTDAEAARWSLLADAVTEGSWTVSGRTVLGDGYGAEYVSIPDTPADAAFMVAAWAAVPRLLADRERLTGERDRAIGFATRVEAENARLRAGTEALATDMQSAEGGE